MKPKILKLSTVILLFAFISAGCQKDEIDYADEGIEISSLPDISIYKTKNDYRDKLTVCLDTNGNITCTPLFGDNPNIVSKNKNGDFILKRRYFLKSGYILEDISFDRVFTDITITEMVETYSEFGAVYWSPERYLDRIIDRDPFTEYYHLNGIGKEVQIFTIGEINEMLENGTIEDYFTRIK